MLPIILEILSMLFDPWSAEMMKMQVMQQAENGIFSWVRSNKCPLLIL